MEWRKREKMGKGKAMIAKRKEDEVKRCENRGSSRTREVSRGIKKEGVEVRKGVGREMRKERVRGKEGGTEMKEEMRREQ